MWGDELRELAIVVEPMHGIDELLEMVDDFEPSSQRRLGVLVDHLVSGSKEERITRQVAGPHVLVTGHPFVDVWAGVRPQVIGLDEWPDVPRSVDVEGGHVLRVRASPSRISGRAYGIVFGRLRIFDRSWWGRWSN